MNRFYLLMLFTLMTLTAAGQNKNWSRQHSKESWYAGKEQEKQKSKEQEQESAELIFSACSFLTEQNFVVEADQIIFKRGQSAFVNATTNFISLIDGEATVQIASHHLLSGGLNGIGGITVEGRASGIECKTDKKGRTFFKMNVMGAGISAIVEINMIGGDNKATVTVIPNFSSQRITLMGKILPADLSQVFKGRAF